MIDVTIMILAAAFPWSTSATTILAIPVLLMVLITYGPLELTKDWTRPAYALPVALFGIAAIGVTWAHEVPWSDRLHAFEKVGKLLWVLPLALHFRESGCARMVFVTYVASSLGLLAFSFVLFISPEVFHLIGAREAGVPVKNYIDQSQGFVLIAVVLLGLAAESLRNGLRNKALLLCAVSSAFLANLAFVNVARTAFIYLPIMLTLLALRYVQGWSLLALFAGISALTAGLLATSPNLQTKTTRLFKEIDSYRANAVFTADGYPAGGAERLEFWRKSIGFVRSAPVLGRGTGSTRSLFAAAAAGHDGLTGLVVDNPHNQTLAVAIQWGMLGGIVLFGMWGAHLWLFRAGMMGPNGNFLALIGFVAVVQNIASSVFNSHLFDFYQGWLYVFVVGILSGQGEGKRLE
ncbi:MULTISPECIES: O-antigen ligase family protein [Bradyrhizobium]|uniref:O-antigen ligase family protein n=1 Tax=Bradyrhizobium TaxID=374 RepID=UPI0013DEB45C|nr:MULTISPECIES: O-antigen ligase family protein [Bradyrhizobium]